MYAMLRNNCPCPCLQVSKILSSKPDVKHINLTTERG